MRLTIESVAAEGNAISHTPEGQVVFVEFAVPGDVVEVRITRKRKAYLEGRIEEIVSPSPYRLEPFCRHFGVCHGCCWQPLPYSMQLEAKRQQVYDQLTRIGHLEIPEVSEVIGSEKTQFYRNKLEFSASSRRWILTAEDQENIPADQLAGLGFHVGKFFDKVVDIEKCYLQRDPSNSIRLFIKKYAIEHGISFYNFREQKGILRNVFIRTAENGQVMLIVCFGHEFSGRAEMLEAIASSFPEITSLYYIINEKLNDSVADQNCILFCGSKTISEEMEGLHFSIGPKSFFQTNTLQAQNLYRVVRDFASLTGNEVVYDLYTGTGTIAQFVSAGASRVIGIEYVPEAIEDAIENARENGIKNCEFFPGDMKDLLTGGFIEEHGRPDVMIIDPPRAGMHPDVVKTILEAAPGRIVYVSCNPASQARDMAMMAGKYRITAVQPVDMFPHTQHVENVCRLELIV